MTHRLVFVCEANVCRSPLMELVLRADTDDREWRVASAGAHVAPRGTRMCALSAETAVAAGTGGDMRTLADAHRSVPLEAATVGEVDLVLTATRAERGVVAALRPEMRSRAFTLREAVQLGAEPFGSDEIAALSPPRGDGHPVDGLARYAVALHARRGLVTPPTRRRSLLGRPLPHPFDTPDAHHGALRAHRAMLAATVDDVRRFLRQASTFLGSSDSPAD